MPDKKTPIDREEVRHVARLARLSLDPKEEERLTRELGAILDYIHTLRKAPVANLDPLTHVAETHAPLSPDSPHDSLSRRESLQNAPSASEGFFLVPEVIATDRED